MDIEQHDYLIIVIITGIIFLQVYVFAGNLRKIRNYRKTIQKANKFEIVEVAVPEDWIKSIEVEEILRNPDEFRTLSEEYNGSKKSEEQEKPKLVRDKLKDFEEEVSKKIKEANQNIPQKQSITGSLNFPEEKVEEITVIEEYEEKDLEFEDEELENEYDGPLKSIRNKFKNILE